MVEDEMNILAYLHIIDVRTNMIIGNLLQLSAVIASNAYDFGPDLFGVFARFDNVFAIPAS